MKTTIAFTARELVELHRALRLISQEDAYAKFNMRAVAIKAKRTALDKLSKALEASK